MATAKERNAELLARIEQLQFALDEVNKDASPVDLLARIAQGLLNGTLGGPPAGGGARVASSLETGTMLQSLLTDVSTALAADPPAAEDPAAAWDRLLTKAEGLAGNNPAAADLLVKIAIERRSRPRVKGAGGPIESGPIITVHDGPPPGSAVAAAHAAALRSPADVIRRSGGARNV